MGSDISETALSVRVELLQNDIKEIKALLATLNTSNVRMSTNMEHINENLSSLCDTREETRTILFGSEKTVGILTRLDRIEQWISKREAIEKVVYGAITAQLVGLILTFIKFAGTIK